ncbi:MAG: hypothetical protein LUE13_08760 [Akkermansiaceae bacterium]|nr:hypothetical protein [Akkermansiaceae bacterium]
MLAEDFLFKGIGRRSLLFLLFVVFFPVQEEGGKEVFCAAGDSAVAGKDGGERAGKVYNRTMQLGEYHTSRKKKAS